MNAFSGHSQNAPPGGGANTTKSANGLEAFVFCGGPSCGGPAPPPVRVHE